VAQWWPRWQRLLQRWPTPIDAAIAAGHASDRAAWAFASGYQCALRALVPTLEHSTLAALCVTEADGNRPRDIRTTFRIDGDRVTIDGDKRWTTLGPSSHRMLVVGRLVGQAIADEERVVLRVAAIPGGTTGMTCHEMPPTRFVPEVPHASLQLRGVTVGTDALLPGDGYDRYVKPFRTIEDIHVMASLLAMLLRVSQARRWPASWRERALATLSMLHSLAAQPADAPGTHLLLAGALHWAGSLYDEADSLFGDADEEAQRWRRDRPLSQVASTARGLRAQRAWERIGLSTTPRFGSTLPSASGRTPG
jgi:alkylation response protein AidB-like acyl-CoA dehydrogenase